MWSFFLQRLNDDVQSRCGRWRLSFSSQSLCSLLSALLLVTASRQIRCAGCCNIVIPLPIQKSKRWCSFYSEKKTKKKIVLLFFLCRQVWIVAGGVTLAAWEWEWRVVGTTPRACKLAVEIGRAEYFVHTTSLLRWYVFRLVARVFLNLLLRLLCVCLSIFFGLFYAYALAASSVLCLKWKLFFFFCWILPALCNAWSRWCWQLPSSASLGKVREPRSWPMSLACCCAIFLPFPSLSYGTDECQQIAYVAV